MKDPIRQTVTLAVSGMTCGSCVARVRKALEEVEGVELADVGLRPGGAAVTARASEDLEDRLVAAVAAAGYRVVPGAPVAGLPVAGRVGSSGV